MRCPAGIGLSSDLCLCGCADSPLTYGLWLTLFIHLRCHRTVPFLCRSGRRHFQQRIRLREARQIRCRARTRARSSPAGGGGSQAHKKIAKIFDNTVGKLVELPAKHLARMSFSPHSRGHTSDRLAGGGDDIRHHIKFSSRSIDLPSPHRHRMRSVQRMRRTQPIILRCIHTAAAHMVVSQRPFCSGVVHMTPPAPRSRSSILPFAFSIVVRIWMVTTVLESLSSHPPS